MARKSKIAGLTEFLKGTELFPLHATAYYAARKARNENLCRLPFHRYLGIKVALKQFKVRVTYEDNRTIITRSDTGATFTFGE